MSHGVPRVDDRRIVSGILFVIRNGLRWRDAPAEYGPAKTIYNRFIRWSRLGVFNRIFAAFAAKGGKPDQLMINATHLKALLQRLAAVRGRLSLCADQAAAAKWWLSMPMASVSAEGPMPKALSTRRTSPLMPGCRHQGRACPLRRARMTSNPLIVA